MREDLYLRLLKLIPKGKVISYKKFSEMTGLPIRVGARILKKNKDTKNLPCYKVVREDGSVGGYSLGVEEKIKRLEREGIQVDGKINRRYFWEPNLKEVRKKFEEMVKEEVKIRKLREVKRVAAVDTHERTCAIVIEKGKIVEERCIKIKKLFPYISGFFFLREGYPTIRVLEGLDFDVALIDAHGLAHPICGLASFVGVMLNKPTIGVAKRYLYGKIRNEKIYVGKKQVGIVYKKLYVSVGNLVSVKDLDIVKRFKIKSKMLEPIYKAHLLSLVKF